MSAATRIVFVLLASFVSTAAASGQQNFPPATPVSNRIYLDVVVTPKSGVPVTGLQRSDFTVLDNKVARPIASFQALGGPEAPVELLVLVDAVNTDYRTLGYEREQIDRFLRANGGHLEHPTSLAIFTDTDVKVLPDFSRDGNALSTSLDQATISLREIRSDDGFWAAHDRLQLSLNALQSMATSEAARPGRKIILWISPGWPLLSGPGVDLTSKQEDRLLAEITEISTSLRRGRITIYNVDPLGAEEGVGQLNYYQEFLKGVSKPNQVQLGDLGLQVLAIQSGGLSLNGNDISSQLQRCVADTDAYYEVSFDPPPSEGTGEYHQVDVKVAQPRLIARTRTGYYSAP